jgi:sugar phosphate isomerase/epimerase
MMFSTTTATAVKRFGISDGIKALASAGYPMLDINVAEHTEAIRSGEWLPIAKEYKAAAEASGRIYNQGHAPFGGGALPDGRSKYVVEKAHLMPRTLEFAAVAGIETLVIHPLNFMEIGFFGNEEYHFEKNMEFFSALTPIARDLGVKIGIENLWHTGNLTGKIHGVTCADPKEHLRYVTSLNAPDVFCACLDIGHSALVDRKPEDVIRALGSEILGALHVHDVDYKTDLHTAPFMGKLNFEEICRALGEIDYKGVLTFEADSFISALPQELISDGMRFMVKIGKYLTERIDFYRSK